MGMVATSGIWIRTYIGGKLRANQERVAVVIDGVRHKVPWGEPFFPLPPGVHTVSASVTVSLRRNSGPVVQVEVPADASMVVRFDAPLLTWQSGKLTVSPNGPEPEGTFQLGGPTLGADGSALYTGPRPSPARRWAPWVVVTSGAAAIGNAVVCGLNLVERHSQQQRLTLNPPSAQHIRDTLATIHRVSVFDVVAAVAFGVLGTVWSFQRRPRTRLRRGGEAAVEASLPRVLPVIYWTFWAALVASVFAAVSATSVAHSGATIQKVISYRGYLAGAAAARTIMWACWIPLVVRATRLQTRREAIVPVGG